MVWCSYCAKDQQAERDDINGFTCCTGCGRVLDDNVYGSDPSFTKTAGGQSQVEGNFVKDGQSSFGRLGAGAGRILGYQSDSHEKTLAKGKHEILEILERLSIRPRDDVATQAHRFYHIALERNFTRGRRTQQVAASCIYIVCRQNNKPYMLIDFSDCLQTNVYVLGAVFLQLCNLLRLEEQPFMQKPVDPSLFIHRFADRLHFGRKMHPVSNTALRLVASMKRDWMQTGRRPSGICGAALFISAHMHGFERSKGDVVSVVHVCEATLKRRLVEFECTESGSLTAEEFEVKGQEMEAQVKAGVYDKSIQGSKSCELSCEHKDTGVAHFSHGLCHPCYEEFVRVSGGMQGGSAPPAFQRAELQRMQIVREQLKGQGLNSDEEDDYDIPIRPSRGRRKGLQPCSDTPHAVEDGSAHLISTGRGRGRGKQRGRMSSKDEMSVRDVDQVDDSDKQRGRGRGRGRGRRNHQDNLVLSELSESEKAGLAQEYASHVIGKAAEGTISDAGLGEMEIDHSRRVNEGEAVNSENGSEAIRREEAPDSAMLPLQELNLAVPDDDDVLVPTQVSPKQKPRHKEMSRMAEETVTLPKAGSDHQADGSSVDDTNVENCSRLEADDSNVAAVPSSSDVPKDSEEVLASAFPGRVDDIDELRTDEDMKADGCLDEDTLSDIDDDELKGYMNNDEEVRLKTIIWTEMNKEYLQEQEAKESALAALEEARAAAIAAAASNSASAAELAAAAAAAVAQMKKDKKQKRVDDAKKPPAQSAAEATRLMLESKRLSTKVDYTVLAKLFDTDDPDESAHMGKEKDVNDSESLERSSKRKHPGIQIDSSQGDSVITQISSKRPLTKDLNADSADIVYTKEEAEGEEEEDEGLDDDGDGEVEGEVEGLSYYDQDEGDDYYEDY